MSDELKAKLRELLVSQHLGKYMTNEDGDFVSVVEGPLLDEYVAEIEQALEREGYRLYSSDYVTDAERAAGGYLTGKQWYDRFEELAKKAYEGPTDWGSAEGMLRLARKAAGLP